MLSLGGIAALLRFKRPILLLAAALAVAALTLAALAWHAGRVQALRSAAHEAGRSEEETKWKLAAATAADRADAERRQDQAKIREIGIALSDARTALREKQDEFDRKMLELESAGGADNRFDPRVVRLLNERRGTGARAAAPGGDARRAR